MGYIWTKYGFQQENHKKKKVFKSIESVEKHFAFYLFMPQFHNNSVPAVSI